MRAPSSVDLPAPDGPITAVRLDGSSWNDTLSSRILPPPTIVVSPSAYSVNSSLVADATSCDPSQRNVWLPKMTSYPGSSATEPWTRCPLTNVPLKLPRSWSTGTGPRSSRAWNRETSGSVSTTSLVSSRPIASVPSRLRSAGRMVWPWASWPGGSTCWATPSPGAGTGRSETAPHGAVGGSACA